MIGARDREKVAGMLVKASHAVVMVKEGGVWRAEFIRGEGEKLPVTQLDRNPLLRTITVGLRVMLRTLRVQTLQGEAKTPEVTNVRT